MSLQNLLLRPEFYYWYLFPTLVEIIICFLTVKLARKKRDNNQGITAIIIFLLIISQWVLVKIFYFGAWPTYSPHLAIFISIILLVVQYRLIRWKEARNNYLGENTYR